ncbi:uncharacterized protein C8R40DRAFT_1111520 [Lentinula edodes]|uniref:uncharacterized protein n=1 Tax=Lentinula edodes TaxID=5353 RepID=UPI001E8E38BC|nr:uncharacterized protein C8R40DRAFT_1111520 [Lentinula edodes]KAH7873733.1 hypothetical protein C8R40DRAFT_1111520 [Lentinula edodes]
MFSEVQVFAFRDWFSWERNIERAHQSNRSIFGYFFHIKRSASLPFFLTLHVFSCFALCLCVVDGLLFSIFLTRCPFHRPLLSLFSFCQRKQATTFISQFLLRSSTLEMFTATKIGALTLSILAASEDVLARPLLAFRQSTNSSIGDFGSCTVPQIQFATGFDNRKETSFEPVDLTSYPHGSAQGIDIITQFMCDQLVNSCGADATAKATCASAAAAADTATAKTGAQADKFNAVFGIQTNFAAVPVVSDQGVTLGVDGSGTSAAASATSAVAVASAASATTTSIAATVADTATSSDPCPATVTVTVTAADAASTSAAATDAATDATSAADVATTSVAVASATAAASSSAAVATSTASAADIGNFGSCTVPQIQFGVGFDNRRETAFEPVDQTSYNHGSADNIAVITDFMCNTLTNTCGADATAKATCATAQAAAAAGLAQTGDQADKFNAVFGIITTFAQVPVVSNTGTTLGVDGTNTAAAATATA